VFGPAPPVTVVEPAGAGDAFAAGYLFGAVHDVDQAARLAIGHRLAAVTMGTAGGMGTPPSPGTLLGAYGDGMDRADAGRVHDG
jgi:2-dehydro-3-deoxygluconokinase